MKESKNYSLIIKRKDGTEMIKMELPLDSTEKIEKVIGDILSKENLTEEEKVDLLLDLPEIEEKLTIKEITKLFKK